MNAEIITIGDEILIGQTIDTNSAWMGSVLGDIGVRVHRIVSVSDQLDEIAAAIFSAESRADIILITGGLGPTRDDKTKEALCQVFDTSLAIDETVLKKISSFFKSKNLPMLQVNKDQALIPLGCEVLDNPRGTAQGMLFRKGKKFFVSMPGVPHEMKGIVTEEVIPRILKEFTLPGVYYRTVMTHGIGESYLSEIINEWEESLIQQEGMLAYLPSMGKVKLRVGAVRSTKEDAKSFVDDQVDVLKSLISEYIYADQEVEMALVLGQSLREKGKTIATAESCTGGNIAGMITSHSGSSDYFKGSIVSYSNEVKSKVLSVSQNDIDDYGAVSEPVVRQMAENVRKLMNVDFAIATSGVAGPNGGTDNKPVGTIWIAVCDDKRTVSKKFLFGKSRARNIIQSSEMGMMMLYKEFVVDSV